MFPVPLFVRDLTIRSRWEVEKAVVLIGREAGEIQLDGTDVSPAHAILFSLNNGIAVSDVGGGTGLLVDGEAVTLAKVKPGQVVQIGSHRLEIGELTNLGLGSRSPTTPPIRTFASQSGPRAALKPALSRDQPDTDQPGSPLHDDNTKPADPITGSPADILSGLAALRQRVTESWDRLNTRNWSSNEDFLGLAASPAESTSRARELEEGDAALRGHLHDLTRLLEQLVEREREVTGHSKRIHEERLKLFRDKAAWAKRQVELDRQAAELARLELVLADRSAGNS